mmetsp:Transcript_14662/g.43836  ORF Transcript_14662/g.43836 Transcript_14662/m.43836 type:complete len:297 (-) Transcript_14662:307-1197(-)
MDPQRTAKRRGPGTQILCPMLLNATAQHTVLQAQIRQSTDIDGAAAPIAPDGRAPSPWGAFRPSLGVASTVHAALDPRRPAPGGGWQGAPRAAPRHVPPHLGPVISDDLVQRGTRRPHLLALPARVSLSRRGLGQHQGSLVGHVLQMPLVLPAQKWREEGGAPRVGKRFQHVQEQAPTGGVRPKQSRLGLTSQVDNVFDLVILQLRLPCLKEELQNPHCVLHRLAAHLAGVGAGDLHIASEVDTTCGDKFNGAIGALRSINVLQLQRRDDDLIRKNTEEVSLRKSADRVAEIVHVV